MGTYKNEDMSGLDITMVRDYATFMALTPNNQDEVMQHLAEVGPLAVAVYAR